MEADFPVTTREPSVVGFKFTIGDQVTKIDKLLFQPDPHDVEELLALVLKQGSGCETTKLRCDNQGTFGKYVNTQFQLGGSKSYVKRTDASKQSTSFTQVNVSIEALKNPLCNQALRDGHDYSYKTRKVVIIDLQAGTATVGINKSSVSNIQLSCTNCTYTKTLPANMKAPTKCPQCKKAGTIVQG